MFTRKVVKPKNDRRFRNLKQALMHIKGFEGFPLFFRRYAMIVCAKNVLKNNKFPDRISRNKDAGYFTLEYDIGLETHIYVFFVATEKKPKYTIFLIKGNSAPELVSMSELLRYRLNGEPGVHPGLNLRTISSLLGFMKQHGATLFEKLCDEAQFAGSSPVNNPVNGLIKVTVAKFPDGSHVDMKIINDDNNTVSVI